MIINLKHTNVGIAVFFVLSGTVSAFSAEDGRKIEVIEVTAQKRSQSITEIPMAITALNSDDLKQMGIRDTNDLAVVVPGFTYSETAFGPPVYTLRGVGFNESSAQATSTVGVYVDEVAVPFPIMTKGITVDIERVELLKGPQGTLYGRNSTAGAINYIAAKPTEDFEAGFELGYDDSETALVDGYVSGALSDSISARFAAKIIDSDEGWQKSITRDETLGREDKVAARLTFDFKLSNDTQALLRLGYSSDESESPSPQAVGFSFGASNQPFDPETAPFFHPLIHSQLSTMQQNMFDSAYGFEEENDRTDWTGGTTPQVNQETKSVSLNITHEISDTMTLTALTGYTTFDDDGSTYERSGMVNYQLQDLVDNGLQGAIKDTHKQDSLDTYIGIDDVTQYGEIDSLSQEIRITNVMAEVTWIAGLYYSKSEVDYTTIQDFGMSSKLVLFDGTHPLAGIPIGFSEVENRVEQDTETYAAFFNADWMISDDLTITTGIRYSEDKADYIGCTGDHAGDLAHTFNIIFMGIGVGPGDCVSVQNIGEYAENPFHPANNPTGVFPEGGELQDSLDEDSTSWRLATNYKLSEDTSVYASYSRGFKAGSFPSLAALSTDQLRPVVKEQLDAYEVGFKTTLDDGAARISGSAFYYDYKDKQLLTKLAIPVFNTAFTLGNVDESEVMGIEFDFQWLPTDNLTISAATSWLDTEVTSGVGFNQLGQKIDLEGSDLPFTADVQATIQVRYDWEVNVDYLGFAAVDVTYSDEVFHDFSSEADKTFEVKEYTNTTFPVNFSSEDYEFDARFTGDSYTIVQARIGIESAEGDWRAYIWGRNLTDEYFASTTLQNNEMITKHSGTKPRTIGINFEYMWF